MTTAPRSLGRSCLDVRGPGFTCGLAALPSRGPCRSERTLLIVRSRLTRLRPLRFSGKSGQQLGNGSAAARPRLVANAWGHTSGEGEMVAGWSPKTSPCRDGDAARRTWHLWPHTWGFSKPSDLRPICRGHTPRRQNAEGLPVSIFLLRRIAPPDPDGTEGYCSAAGLTR